MPNVIFFTHLAPEITDQLIAYAPSNFNVSVHRADLTDEEKISLAETADFIILFPDKISESVLRAAKRLKLIQLVSVGFDRMDLDLCRELNVPVANNGGANSIDVAEHTIALVMGLYRRLSLMDNNVRTDQWRGVDSGLTTYTIDNKTVGLVGLGQIGRRVAKLMNAFGATVLYYDPYPPSAEVEQELGVTRATLEGLLQVADIVSLHVPLNAQTRGLINADKLTLMKSNAILINTCRGPIINEADLTKTLSEGRIAGAGLDVLEKEPPDPNNPILKLDNVLFTPHTAGVTYDTWARRGEFIFQNLQRVWDGESALATVG